MTGTRPPKLIICLHVVWVGCAVFTLAACSSGPGKTPPARSEGEPSNTARVIADWNDVEAAVRIAVSRAEMAVITWRPGHAEVPTASEQVFQILVIEGDQIELVASRSTSGADMIPIELRARYLGIVPRMADARMRTLLDQTTARLSQLAGRDTAALK